MNLVIVGYGSIGNRHARSILALEKEGALPFTLDSLVVVDPSPDQRLNAEKTLGLATTSSFVESLGNEQNIVIICTPSHLHVSLAQQAIRAGCHVFIEKPLSNSIENVKELCAAAHDKKITGLVACNLWFHPGVKKLHELLVSGDIGEPRLFRSYWGHHVEQWHPGTDFLTHYSLNEKQGGGSLFDVGSHEFFIVSKLLGEIEYAKSDHGPSGFLPTQVDDYSNTVARLKNGIAGSFSFNFLDRCRRRSLEIIGEKATVIWFAEGKDPVRERFVIYKGNRDIEEFALHSSAELMYKETIEHFFNCIVGDEEPIQTLDLASGVLDIIVSLRTHGEYRQGTLS